MKPGTPHGDDDDLIRLYHAAADRVGGAPSPAVGDAVRAHARVMAASRQGADPPDTPVVPDAGRDTAANAARWRVSMLASLAVVALAGLLVLQFDRGTPQEQDLVRAPDAVVPLTGDAERSASVPAPQSASESARDLPQARAPAAATAGQRRRRGSGSDTGGWGRAGGAGTVPLPYPPRRWRQRRRPHRSGQPPGRPQDASAAAAPPMAEATGSLRAAPS
ncbi:MAG: hypothetical protein KIT63_22815 [Rhodoferax sp.]|nr:hypothetical protein [Rhodoferax sp.]